MGKTYNINDIALMAGVAKSTVSRYLNGGYVSEKTRLQIENIIRTTGFSPNQTAQNLKSKQRKVVGVVIPRIDSYAVSRTLMGLDDALNAVNMQMLVINCSQSIDREIEALDNLSKQKLAGIVWLASAISKRHHKIINQLESANIPILLLGQTHPTLPYIAYPDFDGAFSLGQYCKSLGHKEIAYLGVEEKDLAVGLNRWLGFKKSFDEADISLTRYFCSFSLQDAYELTKKIINAQSNYTLLLCATDNIALGAYKALSEAKIRIPNDISLTGFGGYDFTQMLHPSLTTIELPFYEAGQIAAFKLRYILLSQDKTIGQTTNKQENDPYLQLKKTFTNSAAALYLSSAEKENISHGCQLDSHQLCTTFTLKKRQSVDISDKKK
ncbi:LacI family DNA-binding transcriptional regulator [Thorsellia kenyensis]|uniref:LacI family DNA-binding transcriptional regulator n=1 Tax=Thorsellia kenyensis TaxID=1549888 RepID=A0ABV6C9Y2_9GAMM